MSDSRSAKWTYRIHFHPAKALLHYRARGVGLFGLRVYIQALECHYAHDRVPTTKMHWRRVDRLVASAPLALDPVLARVHGLTPNFFSHSSSLFSRPISLSSQSTSIPSSTAFSPRLSLFSVSKWRNRNF